MCNLTRKIWYDYIKWWNTSAWITTFGTSGDIRLSALTRISPDWVLEPSWVARVFYLWTWNILKLSKNAEDLFSVDTTGQFCSQKVLLGTATGIVSPWYTFPPSWICTLAQLPVVVPVFGSRHGQQTRCREHPLIQHGIPTHHPLHIFRHIRHNCFALSKAHLGLWNCQVRERSVSSEGVFIGGLLSRPVNELALLEWIWGWCWQGWEWHS